MHRAGGLLLLVSPVMADIEDLPWQSDALLGSTDRELWATRFLGLDPAARSDAETVSWWFGAAMATGIDTGLHAELEELRRRVYRAQFVVYLDFIFILALIAMVAVLG